MDINALITDLQLVLEKISEPDPDAAVDILEHIIGELAILSMKE